MVIRICNLLLVPPLSKSNRLQHSWGSLESDTTQWRPHSSRTGCLRLAQQATTLSSEQPTYFAIRTLQASPNCTAQIRARVKGSTNHKTRKTKQSQRCLRKSLEIIHRKSMALRRTGTNLRNRTKYLRRLGSNTSRRARHTMDHGHET